MNPRNRLSRLTFVLLVAAAPLAFGCARGPAASTPSGPAHGASDRALPQQPYAGFENRPIKALPPERIQDLAAGRGAGYALAAELNHYPGPRHVLDLAAALQLRPEQEQAVRAIFTSMEQEAQALGKQLIALEADLDAAFNRGAITPADLARRTAEIGAVEARLRATHLAAHLSTKEVLSPEQVSRYDQLRGYTAGGQAAHGGAHGSAGHGAGSNGR